MFLLLKAGQEGQYKLLQCSVGCFGDHAVGPEKVSKNKMVRWSESPHGKYEQCTFSLLDDLPDAGQKVLVLAENVLQERLLEPCDLAGIHLVQMPSDTGVDHRHLLLNGHGAYEDSRQIGHYAKPKIYM